MDITIINIVICCKTALKQQKIVKSAIEIKLFTFGDVLVVSHIYSVLCYWEELLLCYEYLRKRADIHPLKSHYVVKTHHSVVCLQMPLAFIFVDILNASWVSTYLWTQCIYCSYIFSIMLYFNMSWFVRTKYIASVKCWLNDDYNAVNRTCLLVLVTNFQPDL